MSEDPQAEIDRLRTALAFYADREQYEDGYYDCCSEPPSIVEDAGLTARQALGIPEPERVVWTPPVLPDPSQRTVSPEEMEENRRIRERMAKFLETVDAFP